MIYMKNEISLVLSDYVRVLEVYCIRIQGLYGRSVCGTRIPVPHPGAIKRRK
jgi:hypothetical protein